MHVSSLKDSNCTGSILCISGSCSDSRHHRRQHSTLLVLCLMVGVVGGSLVHHDYDHEHHHPAVTGSLQPAAVGLVPRLPTATTTGMSSHYYAPRNRDIATSTTRRRRRQQEQEQEQERDRLFQTALIMSMPKSGVDSSITVMTMDDDVVHTQIDTSDEEDNEESDSNDDGDKNDDGEITIDDDALINSSIASDTSTGSNDGGDDGERMRDSSSSERTRSASHAAIVSIAFLLQLLFSRW